MKNILTEHFTLEEFTTSQTAERLGILNIPGEIEEMEIQKTAEMLENVRELLGFPIIITSGYRCEQLNRIIGGSLTSQHMKGQAVDFICPRFGSPKRVAEAIASSPILFDQLIYEGRWVHLSQSTKMPRRVMTASFEKSGVHYNEGIV